MQIISHSVAETHAIGAKLAEQLQPGDVLLHGHTHIPVLADRGDYIYVNPGSVTLPKEGGLRSYLILEEDIFTLKTLSGEVLEQQSLHM